MIAKIIPIMLPYPPDRLCTKKYPGHRKGCPNYNKKTGCPPGQIPLNQLVDFRQCWIIWNKFDLKSHRERMLKLHPKWSKQQAECCLYWQGGVKNGKYWGARGELEKEILDFLTVNSNAFCHSGIIISRCPEAHGMDVSGTMYRLGISIWPIVDWTYQIAVVGVKIQPRNMIDGGCMTKTEKETLLKIYNEAKQKFCKNCYDDCNINCHVANYFLFPLRELLGIK